MSMGLEAYHYPTRDWLRESDAAIIDGDGRSFFVYRNDIIATWREELVRIGDVDNTLASLARNDIIATQKEQIGRLFP